jgi:phage terminase small subunit
VYLCIITLFDYVIFFSESEVSRLNKLTEKQKAFVNEYLIDLNATQAAIRAGYSKKNADKIASQLLGKTRVSEEIKKAMAKREKRTEITQDRVLKELAIIGFAKVTDYVSVQNGSVVIKNTADIDEEKLSAISGIKENQFGIEVKFHDKVRSLELIGEHLGMWNGNNGNSDALERLDMILSEVRDNAVKSKAE